MKQPIKSALSVSAGVVAVVGLVLAPAAVNAVSDTANTTVNATVGSTITVTTTGDPVTLAITPTPTGSLSSGSDVVTVNTNNAAGYVLALSDSDATNTLTNGTDSFTSHAGTVAVPTALANNTWGFAVAGGNFDASYAAEPNAQGSTTKWAGVPASGAPVTIKTTAAVATNETTTVWYAAEATTAMSNGTYTGVVTYTATTN